MLRDKSFRDGLMQNFTEHPGIHIRLQAHTHISFSAANFLVEKNKGNLRIFRVKLYFNNKLYLKIKKLGSYSEIIPKKVPETCV